MEEHRHQYNTRFQKRMLEKENENKPNKRHCKFKKELEKERDDLLEDQDKVEIEKMQQHSQSIFKALGFIIIIYTDEDDENTEKKNIMNH